MTNFGPQVKTLRKARRMTQSQLAEQSGVNAATISAYETQKCVPNLETVSLLLGAMGYELGIREIPDYRN